MATGCLSNARTPDSRGSIAFKGKVYHTGHWPHEGVDFTGLRVGVIGTGSSGIQSMPVIAEQASAAHGVPAHRRISRIPARNAALTREEREQVRQNYPRRRRLRARTSRNGIFTEIPDRGALDDGDDERRAIYEARWAARRRSTFLRSTTTCCWTRQPTTPPPNSCAERSAEIVKDPATAELLQPNDHPIGTKRICVDTDYFEDVQSSECHAGRYTSRTRSRRSPRMASVPAAGNTNSMRSCWRPASTP